jgi:hypothetical protein
MGRDHDEPPDDQSDALAGCSDDGVVAADCASSAFFFTTTVWQIRLGKREVGSSTILQTFFVSTSGCGVGVAGVVAAASAASAILNNSRIPYRLVR